jgi:hypothetical protein
MESPALFGGYFTVPMNQWKTINAEYFLAPEESNKYYDNPE